MGAGATKPQDHDPLHNRRDSMTWKLDQELGYDRQPVRLGEEDLAVANHVADETGKLATKIQEELTKKYDPTIYQAGNKGKRKQVKAEEPTKVTWRERIFHAKHTAGHALHATHAFQDVAGIDVAMDYVASVPLMIHGVMGKNLPSFQTAYVQLQKFMEESNAKSQGEDVRRTRSNSLFAGSEISSRGRACSSSNPTGAVSKQHKTSSGNGTLAPHGSSQASKRAAKNTREQPVEKSAVGKSESAGGPKTAKGTGAQLPADAARTANEDFSHVQARYLQTPVKKKEEKKEKKEKKIKGKSMKVKKKKAGKVAPVNPA
ncbi:hypothetical protein CYMTET_51986, partial [Cymbomonas tetramitiformis]